MAQLKEQKPDLIVFLQNTVRAILEAQQIPPDKAEEIAVEVSDQ